MQNMYHLVHINHNTLLLHCVLKSSQTLFACLELVSVMSSIVRLLTNSFLSGNYFSLNFCQISIWINIFPQHQTKIIEFSITRYIGVMDGLKSLGPIYVKLFLIICIAVYARRCQWVVFCCNILKIRLGIIYPCRAFWQDYLPDLIVSVT